MADGSSGYGYSLPCPIDMNLTPQWPRSQPRRGFIGVALGFNPGRPAGNDPRTADRR